MTPNSGDLHDAGPSAATPSWQRVARNLAPTRQGERPAWELLWLGATSHPWGILAGLLATYTALPLAIFGATIGAIGGAGGALIAIGQQTSGIASPYATGLINGFSPLGILAGAGAGAVTGFLAVYGGSWATAPGHVLTSLIAGIVTTIGIAASIILCERGWLRLYGYRRMSWEEKRVIEQPYTDAAAAMGIDLASAPRIMIDDNRQPGAWVHSRTIVLTTGYLTMHSDQEIAGTLAHELAHWDAGDAVGAQLVWASAWPLAMAYNLLLRLARNHKNVAFFYSLIAWPLWITVRLFVMPVQGRRQREHEYAADAAATGAGAYYRDGLKAALAQDVAFERGRTGWEQALTAAHPPTALRIERLISPEEAARRRDTLAHDGTPRWWR